MKLIRKVVENKMLNFKTILFYGFIYCVWNLFWNLFSGEIKYYFPENKVTYALNCYLLKFGECGKRFFIKFKFRHF